MRKFLIVPAMLVLLIDLGCACSSLVEREAFVDLSAREEYVALNPDCMYNENIRDGEITRGMNGHEVMASWGLPNVYMISRKQAEEYWVYYVDDRASSSILIYTLTFNEDNVLNDWDIDMKRFVGNTLVYSPSRVMDETRFEKPLSRK